MSLFLVDLPFRTPARVSGVTWANLSASEVKRLRNLGLDEGVSIEMLHAAPFGRDPVAVRIGRMTVALRRVHAAAIAVEPEAIPLAAE